MGTPANKKLNRTKQNMKQQDKDLASPSSSPYCKVDCDLPPPQIEGITINFKLLHQLSSPSPSHASATTIKRYRCCNTSTIRFEPPPFITILQMFSDSDFWTRRIDLKVNCEMCFKFWL
ncbi:hypothetical protein LXL04_024797 [Taraxacum kok-saghyz]